MTEHQVFRVNSPSIVSEKIDGEVVIVNLKSGDYYSLINTATDIWEKIEQGSHLDLIVAYMESNYESSSVNIKDSTHSFLEKLQSEGLITIDPETQSAESNSELLISDQGTAKKTFQIPVFERFTDMEDLLLLDPIHEVSEDQGWPNTKEEIKSEV